MALMVIEAKEALMNIGIARAKARLSELVNRVAFGNEYIILESRGKPKAALVSLEDLKYVQSAHPARPTRSQRLLALAQADRVRRSLQSRPLVPSSEELSRLRRERIDGLS
jgi:prevent-host-death family protein